MSEMPAYLEQSPLNREIFDSSEYGYDIITVYKYLEWAIKAQCDILKLTPTICTWSKNGQILGHFDLDESLMARNYRQILRLIMERDELVARHFQIMKITPEEILCSIIPQIPESA